MVCAKDCRHCYFWTDDVIFVENGRAEAMCNNRASAMWATFRLPEQGCPQFVQDSGYLDALSKRSPLKPRRIS